MRVLEYTKTIDEHGVHEEWNEYDIPDVLIG